ncbi:MAG: phasin family protein, partial [Quisquiliibacterium sp.]
MFNTPDQIVEIQKASLNLFQAVALKSFEGFEKLADLNIQATKSSVTQAGEQVKSLLAAKDLKAVADIAVTSPQPAVEKFSSYASHVYEISSEVNTQIAKLIEKQIAEGNKKVTAAFDEMAKAAPAGSEGVVSFVKQAMSAANTAYDQVNKAVKQASDLAEANIAAAAKT